MSVIEIMAVILTFEKVPITGRDARIYTSYSLPKHLPVGKIYKIQKHYCSKVCALALPSVADELEILLHQLSWLMLELTPRFNQLWFRYVLFVQYTTNWQIIIACLASFSGGLLNHYTTHTWDVYRWGRSESRYYEWHMTLKYISVFDHKLVLKR